MHTNALASAANAAIQTVINDLPSRFVCRGSTQFLRLKAHSYTSRNFCEVNNLGNKSLENLTRCGWAQPLTLLGVTRTLGDPSLGFLQGRVRCFRTHKIFGRVQPAAARRIVPTLRKRREEWGIHRFGRAYGLESVSHPPSYLRRLRLTLLNNLFGVIQSAAARLSRCWQSRFASV
jgi:hypothetical protein